METTDPTASAESPIRAAISHRLSALTNLKAASEAYEAASKHLEAMTRHAVLVLGKTEAVSKNQEGATYSRVLLQLPKGGGGSWTQDRDISSDAFKADAVDGNLAAYALTHKAGHVFFDGSEQASFEGPQNINALAWEILETYANAPEEQS
jgi:hypothetical protein